MPTTSAALYPGAYPAAVSWWLDSAGPGTGEVARALAALDEGWDGDAPRELPNGVTRPDTACPSDELASLIAELAGADPARVAGWLTAMTGLGVLRPDLDGRPRYAHPLLRDAVLTGVPAARRRAAHAAAAGTMHRHGVSPDTVARQLLLSDPVGEPWTSAALQEAASLALRDGRTDDAAAFLRRTLREPLTDTHRQRLLTELGSLEYKAHATSAGIPRLSEALRLPGAPQDTVRAAVALGTALAGRGRTVAAVDVLRTVEDELTDRPQLIRTLQTASVLLSEQDPSVRNEVYRWLCDAAQRAPELVGTAGHALVVRHEATAGLISAAEAMGRLRALLAQPADPQTEPFLIGTAAAVAQWADELLEAERLLESGLVGQRPDLLHPMHEALANVRADILAARGEHARLLAEPWARDPARTTPSNRQAHVLLSLVATGEEARAVRFAESLDLRSAPDSWEVNRFLYARGGARRDRRHGGRAARLPGVRAPSVGPRGGQPDRHTVAHGRRRVPSRPGPPPGGHRPGGGGAAARPSVEHAPHGGPFAARPGRGDRRQARSGAGRGGRTAAAGRAGGDGDRVGVGVDRAGAGADRGR